MAKINKNGTLSGSVRNLVFVTNGDSQYVRSKPISVKQSPNTKKAAQTFGLISQKDKIYRDIIINQFKIHTDSRYAARHRANLGRTYSNSSSIFNLPKALEGFCFNKNMPWENMVRLYPIIQISSNQKALIKLPEHCLGENIIVPKEYNQVSLTYYAFTLDLNADYLKLNKISELELLLNRKETINSQDWSFDITNQRGWLFILASLNLVNNKSATGTSSYISVININN